MRIKEMTADGFRRMVEETLVSDISKAVEKGIKNEDIAALINRVYSEHGEIGTTTGVRRIQKLIAERIEAATATQHKGLLIGSKDRYGKNSPIRFLLVKKGGEHLEISNFGNTAPGPSGDVIIQTPSLVSVRCSYDSQFDSYNLKAIEEMQPVPLEKVEGVLATVVMDASKITKEMAFSQGHAPKPVVLFGAVGWVGNEAVFKVTEDAEGRHAEIDSFRPVLFPTEISREPHPCFNFTLRGKSGGGDYVRIHVEPQRHGRPLLLLPDLGAICARAMTEHPDSPEDQAKYLTDWIGDITVYVVGTVNRVSKGMDSNKTERRYIDIGAAAIVEAQGSPVAGGSQQTLGAKFTPAPAPATPAPAPAPAPATPAPAPAPAPATPAPVSAPRTGVDDVADRIRTWCRATGTLPIDLSLETARMAVNPKDNIPDGVIVAAIEKVKGMK